MKKQQRRFLLLLPPLCSSSCCSGGSTMHMRPPHRMPFIRTTPTLPPSLMSTTPQDDGGNIDAAGASSRRRAGVAMLAIAAAAYIGLIVPPDLDRRWLIASAAPCVAGIFCVMQSYQVPGTHTLSPPFAYKPKPLLKTAFSSHGFRAADSGLQYPDLKRLRDA